VRPLLLMLVFTVVFGRLARLPSQGVPYPLFVLAAMLPWQFYASALAESSNSLIANAGMISKVYFPRLIIPVSSVIVSLVDFLVSFSLLVMLMWWYGYSPDWRIFALPLFLVVAICSAIGAGLWFSALNVRYRDFRYIVPFVVQLGLYVSPVGFSSTLIPEKWRFFYYLNPAVGIIDGFRWALFHGGTPLNLQGFLVSFLMNGVILLAGLYYFRKSEKIFADVI
jgi:lipopolysaccharide transport system permease protein